MTVDYYISISSHEIPFTDMVADCALLISPTNFPPNFRYPGITPARSLLIDSGAYHYNTRRVAKDQRQALKEQYRLLKQFPSSSQVAFMHCDVLPRNGMTLQETVEQTLANAALFIDLPLDSRIEKVGVAQARNPEEMYFVVRFLRDLGYERIALGGLAKLHRRRKLTLPRMIEAAVEASEGASLHALGVTGPNVLDVLRKNQIVSCDSATPIWSAVYGSLLYSAPFRRYRLASSKSTRPGIPPETSYYRLIKKPLPCNCPVCQFDVGLLTGVDTVSKHYRSMHNYLHMKAEIEGGHVWQQVSLSADSLSEFMNSSVSASTSATAKR